METITVIISRDGPGQRYSVERRLDSHQLRDCIKSIGEQFEDAVVEMREQLDAEEKKTGKS